VATCAAFHFGDSPELTVGPEQVAGIALREARFFGVGFMPEFQRLRAPDV
jgi:hypothetical protein